MDLGVSWTIGVGREGPLRVQPVNSQLRVYSDRRVLYIHVPLEHWWEGGCDGSCVVSDAGYSSEGR